MTAETLKPFITSASAEHVAAENVQKKKSNILTIILSVFTIALSISLLAFSIWLSLCFIKLEKKVQKMETDLHAANKLMENMQDILGLTHLGDLNEFKREYSNVLVDDPTTSEEKDESKEKKADKISEEDDYYDEKYDSYDDLVKHYAETGKDSEAEDDANFYDDHEKFQDSKKKERHARSVEENQSEKQQESTELENSAQKQHVNYRRLHFDHFVSNRNPALPKYPFLHKKTQRRRKVPTIKSGDSEFSAKSRISTTAEALNIFPAAHFQLNRKMPAIRLPSIKSDSYGDVYIGESVWANDEDYFTIEDGVLRMHEAGLYYIYAQICYNNTFDHNGFVIFHAHKPFLQCLNTVPTHMPFKLHTCHTSGLIHLQANETLHIRDFHRDRDVVLKEANNRSFFGLIKIK